MLKFASKPLKDKVAGPCLRGEKIICLAITEPWAGSDVANIRTEAKLTPDGKHYLVNGEKKWITNGMHSIVLNSPEILSSVCICFVSWK